MKKEERKDPRYYLSDKPPLLMQGFELQLTSTVTPTIEDKRSFTTRVNRGIVNYIDFITTTRILLTNGLNEADYNATLVSVLAGGQEIIIDQPAERFLYSIDLGDRDEQKIPVIINGGQTIISSLFLPDLVSNQNSTVMIGQLIAHYTTKKHEDWVQEYSHFGAGLGLKRRSFRLSVPIGTTDPTNITGVIPKNEGKIIGFSFLYIGQDINSMFVNFSVDDLGLIENIIGLRFSRMTQRDPFIIWQELNPGSTFKLEVAPAPAFTTIFLNQLFVTFYFDN